eukprot:4924055-Amphidinium_carterae.1
MSISTFESYQTTSAITDSRMLSLETLQCLFDHTLPGAGKIHATLSTQTPEVYQDYMQWVQSEKNQIREQVKRELEAESQKTVTQKAETQENKASASECSEYNFSVALSPGDSVSLCVKKAKKM